MLTFNDLTLPCPAGLTLAALLTEHGVNAEQVATAVNGQFVPRPQRCDCRLQPGDAVTTFQPITGG